MISTLSLVAIGGAMGASLRYLFGVGITRVFGFQDFPVAVMTVNILGSFIMGLTHLNPLVATGILGGFTTFSSFSLETVTLIERGQVGSAGVYVALSVGLSVLGLMLGLLVARGVFA
jgi:CrcB protein